MNTYQNLRRFTPETRTYREDVVTSVRVPPPPTPPPRPLVPETRQPIYTNNPSSDRVYKTELIINPLTRTSRVDDCFKCGRMINGQIDNDIKFNNRNYHRHCFTCSICHENLGLNTETTYLVDDNGGPICKKCQLAKAKICNVCQQSITIERYVHFEEHDYHRECFNCDYCRRSLIDQVNIHIQNSKRCCNQCFDDKFASQCYVCSQKIPSGRYTTYKGNKYHLDCFKCPHCQNVIREMEFPTYDNHPCCEQCYQEKFASKCCQCLKPIISEKAVIYQDNKYHPDCFRCGQCYRPIIESRFHTNNSKPCCNQCYEKNIAPQCQQCFKTITVGKSVNYQGKIYHPDCFRCGHCEKIMYESKFYQADNKPCCRDCHEKYFTPKCAKCNRSILERYTTFKGQNYHINCFVCSKCRHIIDEKEKFYDEKIGILCAQCGF
ncbi:hypothetical protein I4U23_006180 [Adineta vaga]|nr:hypothetical protein I4U23_006180 [Adineta vaga]